MRKTVLLRPYHTTLHQLAESYRTHLQTLGHSKNGSQTKYRYLLEFLARMEREGTTEMSSVTSQEIQNHYYYLVERPNQNQDGTLSLKSAAGHMRAIQLFFDQLQAQEIIKSNPASVLNFTCPKSPSSRKALTQIEIQQLYYATETYQEKALLSLAYGCGLRSSELEMLNLEDVKIKERLVIVRKGKGNKRRVIPLNIKVVEDLEHYLQHERPHGIKSKAFMLHSKGERMKYYTWNKYLQRIAERTEVADLPTGQVGVTTHVLRHSIATHLIEQGVDVEQVRKFLGHSQLETTQVYTHIKQEQLQQIKK